MLDFPEDSELKKKIIRYSLLIGIITAIIDIVVFVVVIIKIKKKDNSKNPDNGQVNPYTSEPSWDNLISTPS